MTNPAQAGHVPARHHLDHLDPPAHDATRPERPGIMVAVTGHADQPPTDGPEHGDDLEVDPAVDPAVDHEAAQLLDGQLWQHVFEHAPIALSLVGPSGRQLAGNAAYRAYLGYEPDEIGRLDVQQTTRDEDRAWTQAYLSRLVSGDLDRYTTEKLHVRKDGTEARARLDVTPIRRDGRCIALLGALMPVVERRPMGEGMLRKLIENIHDTISLVDEQGRLLETTGRYRPIMGYPSEFWETRSIFDLLVPGDAERVLELRAQVLARPGETVSAEFSVVSAHNTVEALEVHAVNLLDDPDIQGIVITSRNITEQRALVEDLRRSRDDALAEAELRSRMLATVSHELRNPLHAVQGISELLAHSVLPEAERAMAGTINRQVRDLTRVVDDLLTSSRLELDAVALELEAVDLRALLTDVIAIARTTAQPGVEVHALIDTSIPALMRTDPVRLRQVMSNLVGNAIKFTPEGRVRVLASVDRLQRLSLEVSDTGAGIPPDELVSIFEPFRSASTAGRAAGAGLGLSIVQRIVTMLGGTVEVVSTIGLGSTFHIVLPLEPVVEPITDGTDQVDAVGGAAPSPTPLDVEAAVAAPSSTAASQAGTESADAADGAGPARRPLGPPVLVIEDNLVNQQLARAQLKSMGYDCAVAGSGEDGLAYLAGPNGVDVEIVLMDYHLPGIDGLETTKRIRETEPAGTHVAIVGVTASASLADREGCIAAGMDDYVPKPVSLADLSQAFERVSRLRAAVRERRDAALDASIDADATTSGHAVITGVSAGVSTAAAEEIAAADSEVDESLRIDVATLTALADELGDRMTVVDLVATFLDELDGRLEAIVSSREAGDGPLLRRLVHTITSSARLLGAGELAQRCAEFEAQRLDPGALRAAGRAVREQLVDWAG